MGKLVWARHFQYIAPTLTHLTSSENRVPKTLFPAAAKLTRTTTEAQGFLDTTNSAARHYGSGNIGTRWLNNTMSLDCVRSSTMTLCSLGNKQRYLQ
ncbi:hypothetical protein V6N13_072416 [Hibiscus sabdariffa]|uniref:Uncharacterized protein n=1 Tax=Hibiscus sabdariffa TaxID=183260 RepID=A0ABR2R7M8_9ROSI